MELWPGFFWHLALVSARAFGMLMIVPLGFGTPWSPRRLLLALMLALLFVPFHERCAQSAGYHLVLLEFVFGVILGLPLKLIVSAVGMCAELIEIGRGQQMSWLPSNFNEGEGTILGTAGELFAMSVMMNFGIGLFLVDSFALSLEKLPVCLSATLELNKVAGLLCRLLDDTTRVAISMALPLLLIFACVDLSLCVVSKACPGILSHSGGFFLKFLLVFSLIFAIDLNALVLELMHSARTTIGELIQ